jgi:fructose-1,6-bisphosphatase/inositol monophosphatase family enzyme
MKKFRLYGTSACHLCELAQGMLASEKLSMGSFDVEEVDISASDALFERYGVTIPVLQHPDDRELNWPFCAQQLHDFLIS